MQLSKLEQQALNFLLSREAKYSKQIQSQLASVLTTIYGEMKRIYDKYAINGKLTKVEMTKYNKYSTMESQILKILDPALKANIKTIKHLLPSQFNESFFHYAWAIDNATGLRLSWGLVNTKALTGAASVFDLDNVKNIELRRAIRRYGVEGKEKIRSALLNRLSLGKSFDDMARDLKKSVSKIYSSAITIVRTEGMSAINAGQTLAYARAQENGVNGKELWSAARDERTRYTHRHADGEGRNTNGLFWVGGEQAQYPGDPSLSAGERINCRCSTRFEIEGYEPQLMRTREEGILGYQNYDQYAEQYHKDWADKEIRTIVKTKKAFKEV
jgi:hypothetical protein